MPRALLALVALLLPLQGHAAPKVVATIPPIQSIAASVMRGVAEPGLLLPSGASPHAFALRPSDAVLLEEADLVLWVGPGLEGFMARPLAGLDDRALALADAPGVRLLTGGGDDDDGGHDHGGVDWHVWLAPANAAAMARAIAGRVGAIDPANPASDAANAAAFAQGARALQDRLAARLAPVRDKPFIVFHDAYRYFELAFGLAQAGSVTVNPELPPGAARVADLRALIEASGTVCVFAEPQFEPRLIAALIDGTDARSGTLDPIGGGLDPGPGAYAALLDGIAEALVECLGGED